MMARRGLALRLLIAVLITALLIAVLDIDALLAAGTAVDWEVLTAASLLMLAVQVIAALRWHLILDTVGGVLPRLEALRITFLAMLVALGLPLGQGGDLVRGAMLASGRRTSMAHIVSSTVADRLYGLLSIGLVALPGAILLTVRGGAGPALTAVTLGLAALPLVIPALGPIQRWLVRQAGSTRPGRLAAGLADSLAQLRLTLRLPRVAAVAIASSVAAHLLAILGACLIGRQIGLDAPLWQYLIAVPLVWVITMVPASIGGIGVREASFGGLFGAFGAPVEQGVALGALVSASGIIGILLGGAVVPFLPRTAAAQGPEA